MDINKKFIRFKLNNEWSADGGQHNFNAYIVNNGDINIFHTPSFSNEIIFPQFSESSIYLGTEYQGLEIEHEIYVKDSTLDQYRAFLQWIDFKDVKKIYFDYNESGFRTVKISSISKAELWPTSLNQEGDQKYDIFVNVSFITVGDWAVNYDTNTTYREGQGILNNGSLPMFFDISFVGPTDILIDGRDSPLLEVLSFDTDRAYWDTRTGILYQNEEKTKFLNAELGSYVLKYELEPNGSVVFRKKEGGSLAIKAYKRDYF